MNTEVRACVKALASWCVHGDGSGVVCSIPLHSHPSLSLCVVLFPCCPQKRGSAASEVGSGMLVEHSGRAPRLEMVSFKKLNKGTLAMGVVFKVGGRSTDNVEVLPVVWCSTQGVGDYYQNCSSRVERCDLGMHIRTAAILGCEALSSVWPQCQGRALGLHYRMPCARLKVYLPRDSIAIVIRADPHGIVSPKRYLSPMMYCVASCALLGSLGFYYFSLFFSMYVGSVSHLSLLLALFLPPSLLPAISLLSDQ